MNGSKTRGRRATRAGRATRQGGGAYEAYALPLERAGAAMLAELAHPDRQVRRVAIDDVGDGPAARFALRHALGLDPDATVRACAAARMGKIRAGECAAWLREAVDDPSPVVRDAVWRALARTPDETGETVSLARRAVREEPSWWVRRSALLALAALGGFDVIDALCGALSDPFWRVRHAAVISLCALGDGAASVRARVLESPELASGPSVARAALAWLRARWAGGEALSTPAASPGERPDELLWNADPAVVAARLDDPNRMRGMAPIAWVEYLAESHEALRVRAVRLLAMRGDAPALRASLRWLEEARLPHAAAAVREVFERMGPDAEPYAREALGRASSPGALVWALSWAAEHGCEALREPARAHASSRFAPVRRAVALALGALGEGTRELRILLSDEDPEVRGAACAALSATDATQPLAALWSREPWGARVRTALVMAASERVDTQALQLALGDAHPWVRARAARALGEAGALAEETRTALLASDDPWLRAAVVPAAGPAEWAAVLREDQDPWVRRAAVHAAVSARASLTRDERVELAHAATRGEDPTVRSRAAALVTLHETRVPERSDREDPRAWGVASYALGDADPTVRASWAERFERCGDAADAALDAWLASDLGRASGERARSAAFSWRARAFDRAALEVISRGLDDEREEPGVHARLRAMLHAFPDEALAAMPAVRSRIEPVVPQRSSPWLPPEAPASVERRALGTTGLRVAPLAVSGVGDMAPAAYEYARARGVNTFFWEPSYTQLSRYLSNAGPTRDELVIVAGSFHADPPSIERDVRTALRRLRTDRIDVFLLFWARAPERLTDETYRCLEALKQQGLIRAHGFSTHFRDLAAQALDRHPWDVVMTRHSAAHTGAEERLFPKAIERRAGVLTFSAISYGRMLAPTPSTPAGAYIPTASECYRYSASREGVSAVISAPRRFRELAHNVAVLDGAPLDEERLGLLRAHGVRVREENARFNALLRAPFTSRTPRETVLALLDGSDGDPSTIERWG